MDPKISVIVPVYNMEKYLDRCMSSISCQTYKNLEIIIIDDGSKDLSGQICDNWVKKDKRVQVIHKTNAGLGMARNTGIECCTGEYIAFVDSDDFLELSMFEKMIHALMKNNADTCYCSHQTYANDKQTVISRFSENEGLFSGKDILLDILGAEPSDKKDFNREMSVWGVLFSGEIVRNYSMRFKSEREYISEDLPFDVQYLSKAEKVSVINECLYNYCFNTESLSHKYYADRLEKEKKLYFFICSLVEELFPGVDFQLRYNRLFLGRVRSCVLQEVKDSDNSLKKIIQNIRIITKDTTVSAIVSSYPIWKAPIKQCVFHWGLKHQMAYVLFLLARIH